MTTPFVAPGSDGFYHPANEADVIALVEFARENGQQVRARGATHSVAWSIYTDPVEGIPRNRTLQQSPPTGQINIAFDQMRALEWIDEANGVIEAEPGINLGWDPQDPFGVSTLENSLLHKIFAKGWAVNTLGGITHQTLGGFTATGSAGGSTRYAWDNMIAYRVVDGTGKAEWIDTSHPHFDAYGTSMGLLGIVTRIRLQLVPMYIIAGTEATTPIVGPDAPIDFFGAGSASKPSLEQYLKDTPYTRVVWWPQAGVERIQTWKADRVAASDKDLIPYEQFPANYGGQTEMFLGSVVFSIFGNTNPFRIIGLIWNRVGFYLENLGEALRHSDQGALSRLFTFFLGVLTGVIIGAVGSALGLLNGLMRILFPKLLPIFNPITKPGKETKFNDWYWRSLCMDNTVRDNLLATEFTEIWVPIGRTQQVINIYQEMFEEGGYTATGYFSTEIYGGPPTSGWLHPGYTDGVDEYKDGTVRIDVYWYRDNNGVPNEDEGFLEQYWEALYNADIPFRLHWGKFIPRYEFERWAQHYRDNLPKFGDFLALREERDPDGIFYTTYWQKRPTGSAITPPDGP